MQANILTMFLQLKIVCLLASVFGVKEPLRWDIENTSVVIGKDLKLSCNGKGCPPSSTKKWLGGQYYRLLCSDGSSTDPSKYQMMYNDNSSKFELMIKQFNYTDVNCDYTCSCDFHRYTKTIYLNDLDIAYSPTEKDIIDNSKDSHGKFSLDVSVKRVYPKLQCNLFHQNKSLTDSINVTHIRVDKQGFESYTVEIKGKIDIVSKNCKHDKGMLDLVCNFISKPGTVVHRKINLFKTCEGNNNDYLITWCCFGIAILVISITIYGFHKKKKRDRLKRGMRMLDKTQLNTPFAQEQTKEDSNKEQIPFI